MSLLVENELNDEKPSFHALIASMSAFDDMKVCVKKLDISTMNFCNDMTTKAGSRLDLLTTGAIKEWETTHGIIQIPDALKQLIISFGVMEGDHVLFSIWDEVHSKIGFRDHLNPLEESQESPTTDSMKECSWRQKRHQLLEGIPNTGGTADVVFLSGIGLYWGVHDVIIHCIKLSVISFN